MSRTSDRSRRRAMIGLAVALAIATGLVACGGDDDESAEPETLAIELSQSGRDYQFSVPESVDAGQLVEIQFTNRARDERGAQLGLIEGEHTLEEALEAGDNWGGRGRALPPWLKLAGGVGSTPAGATRSVTQELPAGNYFVVDVDSNSGASFEVSGEGDGELPDADATIEATEYSFTAQDLKAGRNRVLFDNTGREPHVLSASPLKSGATLADVRRFLEEDEGEPPLEDEGGASTTILEGGTRQVVDLDLRAGRYALLCFIPDRRGGPPHVAKGMVSEAVVR